MPGGGSALDVARSAARRRVPAPPAAAARQPAPRGPPQSPAAPSAAGPRRAAALTYARAARSWSGIASAGSRAAPASAAASAAARARDATVSRVGVERGIFGAVGGVEGGHLCARGLTNKRSKELRSCAGAQGRPGRARTRPARRGASEG